MLTLTSPCLWAAVELLRGWLDQGPSLDSSWLCKAGLDEKCVQLLSKLHPKAIQLLHDFLLRLFFAGALPVDDRESLLNFFGQRVDFQITTLSPTARLLRCIESGPRQPSQPGAWSVDHISASVLSRLESASAEAQQMLFWDLQLRCRQGTFYEVPISERGRFFEEILRFFTGSPYSRLYPVYVPPEPQPLDCCPVADLRMASLRSARAESSSLRGPSVEATPGNAAGRLSSGKV